MTNQEKKLSNDQIKDLYDSHPNVTLRQLASYTGKTVAELKQILLED